MSTSPTSDLPTTAILSSLSPVAPATMSPNPPNPPTPVPPSEPDAASAENAPTSFPAFPRLPAEIRHMIWRHASVVAGTTPGVCILTLAIPLGATERPRHAPLVVHEAYNASVLAACTEAYDIVTSNPPLPPRPYNPIIDTLYLGPDEFTYFTEYLRIRPEEGAPWYEEVRHLAVSLPALDAGLSLPMTIFYSVRKLKSFTVVFPGTKGTWDYQTATPPFEVVKGYDGNVLRRLGDEEAETCIIKRTDVLEVHGRNESVGRRSAASEYLRYTMARLDSSMAKLVSMEEDMGRIPEGWDARNECFRLEYRAAVWRRGMTGSSSDGGTWGRLRIAEWMRSGKRRLEKIVVGRMVDRFHFRSSEK